MAIETISTLQELPPLDEVRCDLTPEEIAKRSVDRFNELATAKYMAGQDEHGGCLVDNPPASGIRLAVIEPDLMSIPTHSAPEN